MRHLIAICTASLLALASSGVFAGDLDPPGAPGPTMVDLQTINENAAAARGNASSAANEARAAQDPRTPITAIPVTIEEPGSYVVTQNLTHSAGDGSSGIVIAASNVILDLGGFHLTRSASASSGIVAIGDLENIAVLNGTLSEWDWHGLDLSAADGVRVDGVQVFRCDEDGIVVGSAAVVRDCTSVGNFGIGFVTGSACTLSNCVARSGLSVGFDVGANSRVEGCVARFQLGDNFRLGPGCTVEACTSSASFAAGFDSGVGCTFSGCSAQENRGPGYDIGSGSRLEGCVATGNTGTNFAMGLNVTVRDCVSRDSQSSGYSAGLGCVLVSSVAAGNEGVGFRAFSGSAITDCIARANGAEGFNVSDNSHLIGCTAEDNGLESQSDGFNLGEGSHAVDCTAEGNGGDGFDGSLSVSYRSCVATRNAGHGLKVASGLIVDSNAESNRQDGIRASFGTSIVRSNVTVANGSSLVSGLGAGIFAGSGARIEDNVVVGNERGIALGGDDNWVARNVLRNQPNAIVNDGTGNRIAPFSSGFATAGPWDNFN